MAVSSKLDFIFDQAHLIAEASDTEFSTVHVLFAYFVVESSISRVLDDFEIVESELLENLTVLGSEAMGTVDLVSERAWQILSQRNRRHLDPMLYFGVLLRSEDALAYQLLKSCGVPTDHVAERCGVFEDDVSHWAIESSERVTDAFASLDQVAHLTSVMESNSGRQIHLKAKHASGGERRSRSPGRRRSDRLDALGERRDREGLADSVPECYRIDTKKYPTLGKIGINLSAKAANGSLEPVVGRQSEMTEILDILAKRKSNNPLLLGETGVGKTAVVEGFVQHLYTRHQSGIDTSPRLIVQLDVGSIMAGTHLRGALAERLKKLRDEVKMSDGQIILFIDEIHSLFGHQTDGGQDAANELKLSLARGEFPCIGATTADEYRESIEHDLALARRFSVVTIDEPSAEDTVTIVKALVQNYAEHHEVSYEDDALTDAVRLGRRYLHEQRDPDRTLSIIDWAGAVAKRSSKIVTPITIREVIAKSAKIPLEHLTLDASARFLEIERRLSARVLGQPNVAKTIGDTLIRNLAGFSGGRPIASLLFIGPTGVGKTEVVKTLAELLFGSRDAMTRFDMSEFSEGHTVSRLIGSPPGYVGHQEGGQLTEAIKRRPYQVILLDEIEKAHRDIWNLLLQVTDEGHLTDSRGRRVDFSNTLVIMTSNLGAHHLKLSKRSLGFASQDSANYAQLSRRVLDEAKGVLPLEFWNRLDARLVFAPLEKTTIIQIAGQLLKRSRQQILTERKVSYEVSESAVSWLVDHGGYDPELGARPLRSAIARWVELPVSEAILKSELSEGHVMRIDLADNVLTYSVEALDLDPLHEPMNSTTNEPLAQ